MKHTTWIAIFAIAVFAISCGGNTTSPTDGQQGNAALVDQLEAQLQSDLASLGVDWDDAVNGRIAATAPNDDKSQTVLTWDDGATALIWGFYSTGDYDQNGETNVADITPIAINYMATGPFDANSAQAAVDGDGNGEINLADVTPIAVNFGKSVDSFNVYTSSDPADYPAGNSAANGAGAALLDNVSVGNGSGSGRKQYTYPVASPVANNYYWVRPTDGTDDGSPSNLYQMGSSETPEMSVPIQVLTNYTLPAGQGGINGPYLINNVPMMLIMNGENFDSNPLVFIGATEVTGASLTNTFEITPIGVGTPSMADIGGFPAVAYATYEGGNQYMYYRRATDELGTAWGPEIAVDVVNHGAGNWCSMLEVAGRPAIAWSADGNDGTEDALYYLRADDATGSAWTGAPQILDPDNLNRTQADAPSMQIIDGRPAVGYMYLGKDLGGGEYEDGLRFVMASDADGASWQAPVDIVGDADNMIAIRNLNLLNMDGIPAMGWFLEDFNTPTDSAAYFRMADDANGTTWGTTQVVDTGASGTSSINGKAASAAGDEIKFAAFTVFEPDLGPNQVACISTKIFTDMREGAEMKLMDIVPGAMDWETDSHTVGFGFDAGAGVSSIGSSSDKQVSCGGSMDFLGFLVALVSMFSHGTSDVGDPIYVYALIAEYNFATTDIDIFFAAQELPPAMFQ